MRREWVGKKPRAAILAPHVSDEDSEISQEPAADPADAEAAAGESGAPAASADPLEAAREELARLRDQLLRTAADFDNFRKRARRDVQEAERRGREELLRELLPVFDNLERASAHTENATDVQALADGIRMVMRQFNDTLGRVGVERIDAEGKAFDSGFARSDPAPRDDRVRAGYGRFHGPGRLSPRRQIDSSRDGRRGQGAGLNPRPL